MKNYLKTLFLIFFLGFLSCKTDKKNEVIGTWESFEEIHTKNVLTFYKDSIILDAYNGGFHTNSEWTIDASNIYLKKIKLKDSILKEELVYEYKLNKTKDTLRIKVVDGNDEDFSLMKKVKVNPFKVK